MRKTAVDVGVYYLGESYKKPPACRMSIEEARSHKDADTGFFVNHGRDICLIPHAAPECPDNRQLLAGGSMRDSWSIMKSDGFSVWQMPGMIDPCSLA